MADERADHGVAQYVILGAGLDTFAQRRPQLPAELVDDADRPARQAALDGARKSGTPFISFYTPAEMMGLALDAGFEEARPVSGTSLAARAFADRTDGLRPSSGEDLLIAST